MRYLLAILLCLILGTGALADKPEVCITELWEVYDYDYDYPDEGGSYCELTIWAWTVERRHKLPNGMTGWTYIGYLQLARVLHYDCECEENAAWWCDGNGNAGHAESAEDALDAMLKKNGISDKAKLTWR